MAVGRGIRVDVEVGVGRGVAEGGTGVAVGGTAVFVEPGSGVDCGGMGVVDVDTGVLVGGISTVSPIAGSVLVGKFIPRPFSSATVGCSVPQASWLEPPVQPNGV